MRVDHWPNSWPPPDTFFRSLRPRLVSVHLRQLLLGQQIIIRFNNGWGVLILNNRLREDLIEVSAVRFDGTAGQKDDFQVDTKVLDLTWCTTTEEVIHLCEKVAFLEGPVKIDVHAHQKE